MLGIRDTNINNIIYTLILLLLGTTYSTFFTLFCNKVENSQLHNLMFLKYIYIFPKRIKNIFNLLIPF